MTNTDYHNRLLDAVTTDFAVLRGRPLPFGVSNLAGAVNFAVFSRHATALSLVLFRPGDLDPMMEFPLDPKINRTGDVWHIALHVKQEMTRRCTASTTSRCYSILTPDRFPGHPCGGKRPARPHGKATGAACWSMIHSIGSWTNLSIITWPTR